jgi:predicted acyltransferase
MGGDHRGSEPFQPNLQRDTIASSNPRREAGDVIAATAEHPSVDAEATLQARAERLRSLDVFRGATIAAMILVNDAGDWDKTYRPLLHAEWHGWTPTDLVFPFFLFAVGVAIPYAFAGRLARSGGDLRPLHRQIVRRTLLLFAIGLFLAWFPFYTVDWSSARIPGVLQRIAVVYFFAALVWLHLGPRARALLFLAMLAAYWLAMVLVPVPGHGAGDLSPQGNLAAWVDHAVLGRHTWKKAPGPGDPEGILSTLPAIATALAGLFTGDWLRSRRTSRDKLKRLLLWGVVATVVGLALAPWFPINKNLWTSTYVVFTAGAALLLLAAAYYLVDMKRWEGWARPFSVLGTNAIFAFAGSTFMAKVLYLIKWTTPVGETVTLQAWLYRHLFVLWLPDYVASLAWALMFTAIWWGLTALLYRRRIFIKI